MLSDLRIRLRSLLRRARVEQELDDELRFHMDQQAEKYLRAGMSREEALRRVRIEFGGIEQVREDCRDARGIGVLESALYDARYSLRQMKRSPGFALTAVLMLAFGIAATTAIFSVVYGVLLRPLPFPHAEQLVTLGDQVSGFQAGYDFPGAVTPPEVLTYQRETRSFQSLGAYTYASYALSGAGQPSQIQAGRMTPSVFSVLGVAPVLGRVFTPEEDRQKTQVAVLSYAAWKSRFSGNPRVIGATIDLDREPYTVIGVMPRSFEFPLWSGLTRVCDLWVPMSFSAEDLSPEGGGQDWYLLMVGRLRAGVTVVQAEDDAQRVSAQIMRSFPPDLSNIRIHAAVHPLHAITVSYARPLLRTLFFAVAVVLLIACANFAGLLLVRAVRRQRETAVRLALGATAKTLLRQTIVESLVLSLSGGLIGVGFAAFAVNAGRSLLPEDVPLTGQIALNWTVAAFGFLLALLTGVFCGLAPGFAALRTNVNASLKEGGHTGSASGSHARLRSALVVAEIAIALVLLCASGLLLRSYLNMGNVDLGFQPDHVTTAAYSLPPREYSTQAQVNAFTDQVLLRLSQTAGVQSVALTDSLPLLGGGSDSFVVDGYVNPRGPGNTTAASSVVQGDFFRAMGIALVRGRYLADTDDANSQLAVIVNRRFAERYWPGQNPIGKRMRLGTRKSSTPWMIVVGEVADVKLGRIDTGAHEQFYTPVAQSAKNAGSPAQPTDLYGNRGYIVVRSALPSEQIESAMRSVAHSLDPQLPLTQAQTMEQVVSRREAPRRFNAAIASIFALAAVLLTGLGIYSVVAFSVASRVHEMAIRMALGSQRGDILRLVLISGAKLAGIGAVIGMAGAIAAAKLVRGFLFQVSPFDPVVLVVAAIAVLALALVASAIPARRAATIDPIQALRGE
jgi:predicted permease